MDTCYDVVGELCHFFEKQNYNEQNDKVRYT